MWIAATDKVADETCKEKLCSQYHCDKGYEERSMVGKQVTIDTVDKHHTLLYNQPDKGDKAYEEHERPHQTEDVHGLLAEIRKKPECQQVKIPIEETVYAKLRLPVLACLMVNHLFADMRKASLLGKIRNVTVHLTVDFNVLHHIAAVRLQSAVEVMQVMHTADPAVALNSFVGIVFDRGS